MAPYIKTGIALKITAVRSHSLSIPIEPVLDIQEALQGFEHCIGEVAAGYVDRLLRYSWPTLKALAMVTRFGELIGGTTSLLTRSSGTASA